MKYLSKSEQETQKIASEIAKKFKSGIIALEGELGAGKTIFAKGFAKGLGIKERILSPTFIIIREHKIPKRGIFAHIDLYRLETIDPQTLNQIKELNVENNILLIEWAKKMKNLPPNALHIVIEKLNENTREISTSLPF